MFVIAKKTDDKVPKIKEIFQKLEKSLTVFYIDCFDNLDNLEQGELTALTYFLMKEKGQPLFVNNLPLPPYWEITTDGLEGYVYDHGKKKAVIQFRQPQSERTVARIYWYDDDEKCIWIDYYSAYGWKVCRELLDEEEKSVLRTIYDSKGREVLVEWLQQDKIAYFDSQKNPAIYPNRHFFLLKVLEKIVEREDILILGEEVLSLFPLSKKDHYYYLADDITEADKIADRVNQVLVMSPKVSDVSPYTHLYGFALDKPVSLRPQAIIVTNSEWIEGLEQLLIQFPEIDFHVGAVTEMGNRITNLSIYSNLHIYEGMTYQLFQEILDRSSFYFDIQYDIEIFASSLCAVEQGVLLFTLDNLTHHEEYKQLETCHDSIESLIQNVRQVLENHDKYHQLSRKQAQTLGISSLADYRNLFDSWERKNDGL